MYINKPTNNICWKNMTLNFQNYYRSSIAANCKLSP